MIATWDLKVPGRSMTAILGQHKHSVSFIKFWRQPHGSNVTAENNTSYPPSSRMKKRNKNYCNDDNLLHLVSGAVDGTICFFDFINNKNNNLDYNNSNYNNNENYDRNNDENLKLKSFLKEFRDDLGENRNMIINENGIGNENIFNKKKNMIEIVNIHMLNCKEGCLGLAIVTTSDGKNAVYDALNGILLGNISMEKREISSRSVKNKIASNFDSKKCYFQQLLSDQIETFIEKDKEKVELNNRSQDEETVILYGRNKNKSQTINSDNINYEDKYGIENTKEWTSFYPQTLIPNRMKFKPFISSNNKSLKIIFLSQSNDLIFSVFDLNSLIAEIFPDLSLLSSLQFFNFNKTKNNLSNYLNISFYERENLSIYRSIISPDVNKLNTTSSSTSSSPSYLLNPKTENRFNAKKKIKNDQYFPNSNNNKFEGMAIEKLNLLPGLCAINNISLIGPNPNLNDPLRDPIAIAKQFAIHSQIERNGRKIKILRKLESLSLKL